MRLQNSVHIAPLYNHRWESTMLMQEDSEVIGMNSSLLTVLWTGTRELSQELGALTGFPKDLSFSAPTWVVPKSL